MFGAAKGLGKTALKKVPVIGSLMNVAQVGEGVASGDKGMIGSGVGGMVGAAVGSLVGPLGTVVGGIIGDSLGSLIGDNWDTIADTASNAYSSITKTTSTVFDKVKGFFSGNSGNDEKVTPSSYSNGWSAPEEDSGGTRKQRRHGHVSRSSASAPSYDGHEFEGKAFSGLSKEDSSSLAQTLSMRESGGKLNAENSYGYMGKYQFDASALMDSGLIKKDKFNAYKKKYGKGFTYGSNAKVHKAFLNDPKNWTIKGGKDTFMKSHKLQDQALSTLWNKNGKTFKRIQGRDFKSKDEAASYYFGAHLMGAGRANTSIKTGKAYKDGYGTSINEYGNLGIRAIHGRKKKKVVQYKKGMPELKKETQQDPMLLRVKAEQQDRKNKINGVSVTQHATDAVGLKAPSAHDALLSQSPATYENIAKNEIKSAKSENSKTSNTNILNKRINNKLDGKSTGKNGGNGQVLHITQDVSDRNIAHIISGGIAAGNIRGQI